MTDEMMTVEEYQAAVDAMASAGKSYGYAAATWLLDGNSTDAAASAILQAIENCELDVPSPFSGEWADGLTVADAIYSETEWTEDNFTPEEIDELAMAFEEAYVMAYLDEAERSARAMLHG